MAGRLRGWLRGGNASDATLEMPANAEQEQSELAHTLESAEHIMNDDPATAEKLLREKNDPFHKQGLSVVTFLRATIGFEKEVMLEASQRLSEAETAAEAGLAAALANPETFRSAIYPDGAMYMQCIAQARNLSAIVGVLNENLTEAIKGFLKLRKAYLTLARIVEAEEAWLAKQGIESSAVNSAITTNGTVTPAKSTGEDDSDDDDDFYDADDDTATHPTDTYQGRTSTEEFATATKDLSSLSLSSQQHPNPPPTSTHPDASTSQDDPTAQYIQHPIDIFIHSATSVNFGIMLLLISLIPPTFSKLLSLAGFRGDREKGLRMLWRATNIPNIYGSIAALVLLAYYNMLLSFIDILPESAYPRERCDELLARMRKRYDKSRFWYIQALRTEAAEKRLEESLKMSEAIEDEETQMKQIEALHRFETAINAMCLHRFPKCADSFLKCVELNSWSHGLYYYIAGAAYLEDYRLRITDWQEPLSPECEILAAKAEEMFLKVPEHIGKKKFMGRGLPFDDFIARKISKWQARSREWNIRLADAVGVSPLEEMILHWGGYSKQRKEHLEASRKNLEWCDDVKRNRNWGRETFDEFCILSLLRGVILRQLGETEQAREKLLDEIIEKYDWSEFKGGFKDNYMPPLARYEMAVCYWKDSGVGKMTGEEVNKGGVVNGGLSEEQKVQLRKAREYVEQVAKWDHFDLAARFGMKVTVARNTLNRFLA